MADQSLFGAFVPTTPGFGNDAIEAIDINSPDFKQFLVHLRQSINDIQQILNIKDSGYYYPVEFVNGQLFFPNPLVEAVPQNIEGVEPRQAFRILVDFGALPDTAETSVAHTIPNIGANFTLTRMYGAASDTTNLDYIPLPYASPVLADNIEIRADATNVYVKTGKNRTSFDKTLIVLEYLRN